MSGEYPKSSIVVHLPAGISSGVEIIDIIARDLRFPEWHGRNWNALFDCLCDLSWIEADSFIIEHEAIPDLEDAQLHEYAKLLRSAIASWLIHEGREKLVVIFRTHTNSTGQAPDWWEEFWRADSDEECGTEDAN